MLQSSERTDYNSNHAPATKRGFEKVDNQQYSTMLGQTKPSITSGLNNSNLNTINPDDGETGRGSNMGTIMAEIGDTSRDMMVPGAPKTKKKKKKKVVKEEAAKKIE
jgi:hypothetical protein